MSEEQLITFGELLKIKREKMRYTQNEARIKSECSSLPHWERGSSYPNKDGLVKIIAFYNITEEELTHCKPRKSRFYRLTVEQKMYEKINRIAEMRITISEIIQEANQLDESGILAKKLKTDVIETLRLANEHLYDALIIDRLL